MKRVTVLVTAVETAIYNEFTTKLATRVSILEEVKKKIAAKKRKFETVSYGNGCSRRDRKTARQLMFVIILIDKLCTILSAMKKALNLTIVKVVTKSK